MLLTVNELASQLHINPSTLYAWASRGKIPCLKLHGLVRFVPEDIERWIKSSRVEPGPKLPHFSNSEGSGTELDTLIARAKRQAYNPRPRGNQTQSSPIGKEKTDGAL